MEVGGKLIMQLLRLKTLRIKRRLIKKAHAVDCTSPCTFFPDPNPESTSVDGRCSLSNGDTFAIARAAADCTSALPSDVSGFAFTVAEAGDNRTIGRTFLLFDTSTLPDTANITSA